MNDSLNDTVIYRLTLWWMTVSFDWLADTVSNKLMTTDKILQSLCFERSLFTALFNLFDSNQNFCFIFWLIRHHSHHWTTLSPITNHKYYTFRRSYLGQKAGKNSVNPLFYDFLKGFSFWDFFASLLHVIYYILTTFRYYGDTHPLFLIYT